VSASRVLSRLILITACLLCLLMTLGAGAASAAGVDNSAPVKYNEDNESGGFSVFYPHHCWQGFDMIYYRENVWEAFFKGGVGTPDEGKEIAVYLSKYDADNAPVSSPTHYTVPDAGEYWGYTGDITKRRHSAVRFAVFKDRLFLYIARTYDDNTGMTLWQKELADSTLDGTAYKLTGQKLWEDRPHDSHHPKILQGLVVKVINDTIYVLGQQAGSPDLWLMTSTDALTFTPRQKVHTFNASDCLLTGEVIARGKDGAPLITFVTRDDNNGNGTGTIKLFTFDPQSNAVAQVGELTDHYMDVAMVAGDVKDCTPYGRNNLQLWGIGWGSGNVYHMQFVFNDAASGGTFDPGGIVDHGSASSHVTQDFRGYLAACSAPERVSEVTPEGTLESLQMTDRVWWWGSTDTANAHGRSLKYYGDFLKNLGLDKTSTSAKSEINDTWVLQGVLMGLPPYYPNATKVGWLNAGLLFSYGIEKGEKVETAVTSEKTFSMSYNGQGFFGIPVSVGFGYSNALEQTAAESTTTTFKQTLTFGPDNFPDLLPGEKGIQPGSQAWGIFLAPTISSEQYELYQPDKAKSLGVTLYYTYISADGASLIPKQFDMTNVTNDYMSATDRAFWAGMTRTYPNSKTYWDARWNNEFSLMPAKGGGTADFETTFDPAFNIEGNADWRELTTTSTSVSSRKTTNTLSAGGGAFGIETEEKGSLSLDCSTATTFGTHTSLWYGLFGWESSQITTDYPNYLTKINLSMYLLKAKTKNAFWIPDGARTSTVESYPWCICYHVNSYENKGMLMLGDVQKEVSAASGVSSVARVSIIAKLRAVQAAHDRGNLRAARAVLAALVLELRLRAGTSVPRASAERWIRMIELFREARL
jgi:hypothetical protein